MKWFFTLMDPAVVILLVFPWQADILFPSGTFNQLFDGLSMFPSG